MALAGAGRAEEADVGGLLDPGELREVADQWAFGAGLGGEVEVLQRLGRREAGGADALAGTGGLAREHLCLAERLEELLVGPALGPRALGRDLESLEDAGRLERAQQVRQPVAH